MPDAIGKVVDIRTTIKGYLRPIYRYLTYGGFKRRCPVCGQSSRRFLAYGVELRPDAMCPFCGSLERHRLLWLFLERKVPNYLKISSQVLHIAPELVLEKKFRKLFGRNYITADLHRGDVDVRMDISDIQYADGTFGFVYCSHVLEHVPDDKRAMRELRRVLTDNGLAILLVPIDGDNTFEDPSVSDPKDRLKLFGQEDHVRRYGLDFEERLREAGFKVERTRPGDFLSTIEIEKMGISKAAGDIYSCKK